MTSKHMYLRPDRAVRFLMFRRFRMVGKGVSNDIRHLQKSADFTEPMPLRNLPLRNPRRFGPRFRRRGTLRSGHLD